jgi:hypothetical protein
MGVYHVWQVLMLLILIVIPVGAKGWLKTTKRLSMQPVQSNFYINTKSIAAIFVAASVGLNPTQCFSAENGGSAKTSIVYKTGKTPIGLKPAGDSKVGTKKDSSFLKCVSNCKSDCQLPNAGLAKNDCVQDCQDQCCTSYEQCSFKIKASAGNAI